MGQAEENQLATVGERAQSEQIYLGETGIRLVYGIVLTLALACVIGVVLNLVAGRGWFYGSSEAGVLVCGLIVSLIRRQRIGLALKLMFWCLTLFPIVFGMMQFGIDTPGLFFVPVAIMAASWVLSTRQGLSMMLLACVISITYFYLISIGRIVVSETSPLVRPVALLATIIIATLVGLIGSRALRAELQHVKDLARSLTAKADQLQRSEISFSTLFRSNPLPSLTGDAEGRVLDVNDAWLATFGHVRENLIGRTVAELAIYVDDSERQLIARQTIAAASVIGQPARMRMADGSTRSFLVSTSAFQLVDGWRYVALLLDQTGRLAAEEAQQVLNMTLESRVASRTAELTVALDELRRTQNELMQAEKLASLGAMVAGIAHALNTPVGNALMVTTTLAHHQLEFERELETGLKRSRLNVFLHSVRETNDLVDRNLRRTADLIGSFKQVAVDRTSEQRRQFKLDEIVSEISLIMNPVLRTSPYTLINEVSTGWQMDSYPGPLGQVLVNLAENALTHAFEGRDNGQLRVSAQALKDGWVRLVFADNGTGIAQQDIGRIFDPFFTTKFGHGGSGLGLSIVHNIVTGMLGGHVEVQSVLGEGTVFHIDIPLSAPENPT